MRFTRRIEMYGDAMCDGAEHISLNLFAQIKHFGTFCTISGLVSMYLLRATGESSWSSHKMAIVITV